MRLNPRLDQLPAYPTVVLDRLKAEIIRQGRPVYDFGTGDPTEPAPDFIKQKMISSVPDNCRYPTVVGERSCREAFATYAKRRFGVDLDPDTQILPTAGSKEVIFHMPLMVIDEAAPDKTVVFPDPGYSVYYRGVAMAGGTPYPQKLEGDFIQRIWELPKDVLKNTRMAWINSPHNPTGAVMSKDDLRRTWETCREYDILLCSDETYMDVWYDTPPVSLLEVATEGFVSCFSLSKRSGMTGYRTGMMAGSPDVMKKLKEFRANPGLASQDFVNAAASVAWVEESHVEERRHIFEAKRKVLLDFLHEAGMEVVASDAAFYIWVKAPKGYNGASYAEKLLSVGILTNPGNFFAVTDAGDDYFRLALVPDVATCKVACEIWKTIL